MVVNVTITGLMPKLTKNELSYQGTLPGKMEKARQCAVRAKRAQSLDYCERCNQALCAYPYFKRYHILQNYKIPCDVPKPPTSQNPVCQAGGVKRWKFIDPAQQV